MAKIRRMDERTRKGLLKGNGGGYIIKNIKSRGGLDTIYYISYAEFNRNPE